MTQEQSTYPSRQRIRDLLDELQTAVEELNYSGLAEDVLDISENLREELDQSGVI